jgi:hypothetical protein
LIELSKHVFEPLRKGEDFVLSRGRNEEDLSQVMVLAPAMQDLGPESLKRLEHEYLSERNFSQRETRSGVGCPTDCNSNLSTGTVRYSCWRIPAVRPLINCSLSHWI